MYFTCLHVQKLVPSNTFNKRFDLNRLIKWCMFVFDWWSSLTRRGRDGTLLVDDQDVVSGQSGGPLRMLNVKGSLFLGKNTTELLEMSWGKNHIKIKVESVPGHRSITWFEAIHYSLYIVWWFLFLWNLQICTHKKNPRKEHHRTSTNFIKQQSPA